MRILVTGSNRGIGLEYVRQLLHRGDQVFAACRNPDAAQALDQLKGKYGAKLVTVAMDVTDSASVSAVFDGVRSQVEALDLVINNAAVNPGAETLSEIKKSDFMHTFEVNVAGVMLVAQQCVDLLKGGENPRLINISSGAGSIAQGSPGMYSYRVSKAALNMFNRVLYQELEPLGIISIVLNPGWVITDMGGPNASLQPEDSIRQQLQVIDALSMEDSGLFKNLDGTELPW